MRVVILSDPAAVAQFAADELVVRLRRRPAQVLGLATGGTPVELYQRIIQAHRRGDVSLSQVTTFNLDEYVGLAPEHPASYRSFMNAQLFDHVDVPRPNTHVPLGAASDLAAEACRYEGAIAQAGGIDWQLLGIGRDGHIAFNEPGSSLRSRTRVKTLTAQTRQDNARFFASLDDVPRSALTMGIGTILDARSILLMATGESKAAAIAACVEGPITASVPASALQWHAATTIVVDRAAAAQLHHAAYYLEAEAERQRLVPSP